MISSDDHYSWEERFDSYRGYQNISQLRLSENIADYFNGVVLQRLSGLVSTHDGKMRFQVRRIKLLSFCFCNWILMRLFCKNRKQFYLLTF